MTFLRYQLEVAPSTGKLHAQGAVRFSGAMRMAAILKELHPMKPHLQAARRWNELKEYCAKVETRLPGTMTQEWGEDIGQGARVDLQEVCQKLKLGATLRQIALEAPDQYVRMHKGFQALHSQLHPPVAVERRVALFWGETASGKTRMVFDHHPDAYTVFDIANPWFDGYVGQEVVLFDECGPGMMNHNLLKRLLDRYPMTVPIKGGSTSWLAKKIVLTSNVALEGWFESKNIREQDFLALKRRMRIFCFPMEKEAAEAWMRGEDEPVAQKHHRQESIDVLDSDDDPPIREPIGYLPTDLFDLTREEENVWYSQ